jgi:hypothetical protein
VSTELQRGVVPPGTYANGTRSPIVHVLLCASCAGYAPMTWPDYWGFLSGACQGCGAVSRELHRFPARINSASGCACTGQHERVTGDLTSETAGPGAGQDHYARFYDDSWATEHPRDCWAYQSAHGSACAYHTAVRRVIGHGAPIDGRWRITGIDGEGLPTLEHAAERFAPEAGEA